VPALILDRQSEDRLRRSPRRAAFYCGAVSALAGALAARGSGLVVRTGPRTATVRKLARESNADAVVWSAGYYSATVHADRVLQTAIEEQGLRAVIVHDAPAAAPEETSAARSGGGAGYRALGAYLAAWATVPHATVDASVQFVRALPVSEELPVPARFGSAEVMPAHALHEEALALLEDFLRGPALAYSTARNVPALPTSRLSAHLSFGTISARTVLERVDRRAADPFLLTEERLSLAAFTQALARRDFFLQLAWFYERSADQPLQPHMRTFAFARAHAALDAWRSGRTGYPLVDAGMRELHATGGMHPRARQVAASFLAFDLGVDWRVGRDVWDRLLIEDDPALATGNWQWIAGVGADLAQFPRIFNPNRQARRLDPEGTYVRRWVPELAGLPTTEIFEPDARTRRAQLSLPLFDGAGYPAPVVDHEAVARAFLSRYVAHVRAGSARS
jgi:deoxyribodipyrimidine photo-lyase